MTDRPPPGPEDRPGSPGSPGTTGTAPHETDDPGLSPEEEPVTTGTLFIMVLFLMALAGMWALMYLVLLER